MKIRILVLAFVALLLAGSASATYTQQFALGNDSTFQGQIMVAMLQSAITVLNENVNTNGHAVRASFANRVVQNPTFYNPIIAIAVASQTGTPMTPLTVPSTVSDALIQSAMDGQWSSLAGYYKQ